MKQRGPLPSDGCFSASATIGQTDPPLAANWLVSVCGASRRTDYAARVLHSNLTKRPFYGLKTTPPHSDAA
jgi:hypothetical protein